MTTLLNGALGGLVAGLLAAAAAALAARGTPQRPAVLGAVLDDATPPPGWLLATTRVLYGGVAGIAFVALELFVLGVLGVPPTLAEALLPALAWAVGLLVAVVGTRRLIAGRSPERSHLGTLAFHLAYGLALGLWVRLTWVT